VLPFAMCASDFEYQASTYALASIRIWEKLHLRGRYEIEENSAQNLCGFESTVTTNCPIRLAAKAFVLIA